MRNAHHTLQARLLAFTFLFVTAEAFSLPKPRIFHYLRNRIRPGRRVMQPETSSALSKTGQATVEAPIVLTGPQCTQSEVSSLALPVDREAQQDSANFYDAFVDGLFATSASLMPRLSSEKLENKGFGIVGQKNFDFDINGLVQERSLLHEFLSSSEARRRGFASRKAQPFEVVGFMDVDAKRNVRPVQLRVKKKQDLNGFNNILSLEYWRGEGARAGSSSSTDRVSSLPVTDCGC